MKKVLLVIMTLLLMGCSPSETNKLQVAVSIVPQETFVKKIAGDLIDVVVMIPPGYSPANYEPSPKHMARFDASSIYFTVDVAAEEQILDSVHNDKMAIIDLADVVDDLYPARYFEEDAEEDEEDDHDHDHEGRDPHMWLSPKRAIVMIESMKASLIELDPSHAAIYEENAQAYIKEIQQVDAEFKALFSELTEKTFLIYHPSYGYFADDYDLEMVSIEKEGKEATIRGIEEVIELALDKDIKVVFYQEEFDGQQAEIVAKEIGGTTIKVAPLSGDYLSELHNIVNTLKDILN